MGDRLVTIDMSRFPSMNSDKFLTEKLAKSYSKPVFSGFWTLDGVGPLYKNSKYAAG